MVLFCNIKKIFQKLKYLSKNTIQENEVRKHNKRKIKIIIEEIDSQSKLDTCLQIVPDHTTVKHIKYLKENDYYYLEWYAIDSFPEWATVIGEFRNGEMINFYSISLQGFMEQEGAYKDAEKNAFIYVIKPFLNSRFPEIKGKLKLFIDTYDIY